MMWRTHVMGGVAALWLLAPLPQFAMPDTMTLACLAAGLGALLPDLDANNSKIRHLGGSGIYPFAPVAEHMNREYHHRGALHSPVGALICGVAAFVLGLSGFGLPAFALWLGYVSHLALDACTVSGIPFAPFRKRLYLLPKRLRVVTSSPYEEIVFAIVSFVSIALALRLLVAMYNGTF